MNGRDQKYKAWCFTLNNYTEEEEKALREPIESIEYFVAGVELGERETPHLQGYVEFRIRKRLMDVKRIIGQRGHYERRRGSALEAAEYCKKDGNFFEYGSISKGQGARTDLDEIRQKIKSGTGELDIADNHFGDWVRYNKAFKRYRDLVDAPRLRPELKVYFLWGAPGTGKTRLARHRSIDSFWICSDTELKWFDGYEGETAVILDDYRGQASDSWILRVLDIYELRVPIKGGFVSFNPDTIYITSNLPPYEIHSAVNEAFRRRIKKVIHFQCTLNFEDADAMERMEGYF